VAKVTVETVASSGNQGIFLIEKHSCDLSYCTGDCTCAVVGKRCDKQSWNNSSCTENSANFTVDVEFGISESNQTFSASSACLSTRWSINDSRVHILRYEWSVGWMGYEAGVGIFDNLTEHVWYDVEKRSTFTYCLSRGKQLKHSNRYVTHIRAWTSPFSYSTFKSRSLTIDHTPPSIRRGKVVTESEELCRNDLDFSNSTDKIIICFRNVFTDQESGILKYVVKIGTHPQGVKFD